MVQDAAGRYSELPVTDAHASASRHVVPVLTLLALAFYLAYGHWLGRPMNGDADDLLKLHEIRSFLATGAIFDRSLPDILQPEPYVSHWPWIVDLPYALVAALLGVFVGPERALSAAVFAVPLLLLVPAFFCYARLVGAVGFRDRTSALPLAVLVALPGFAEFAPGRIDYHNLQVLLLLTGLVLLLKGGRGAAFANGVAVTLATAISPEFAAFHALLMSFYAFDYIAGRAGGTENMAWFGGGMLGAAAVLFVAIVPPENYGIARCDTYSAPFALALGLAGAVFVALPALAPLRGWTARAVAIGLLTATALGVTISLFPQCLGGPYAVLEAHYRDYFLAAIGQEKSFLERGDLVLSGSLPSLAVLLIGALAPAALCLTGRRDCATVAIALFSVLAVVQALFYFRYLRYVPFFSGLGLPLVVAALLPPGLASRLRLECALPDAPWQRLALPTPGAALAMLLAAYYVAVPPATAAPTVITVADAGCGPLASMPSYDWPQGAVVLAPPVLGVRLLAAEQHPAVVATPHHPAARGIERVARFLNPGKDDPRVFLDQSRANMVAVCAWQASFPQPIEARYPFAASLMKGVPPPWLRKCPADAGSGLRLYGYGDAPCPTSPGTAG